MNDYVTVAQNLARHRKHKTYYAVWSQHGQKKREALKTTDRAEANELLRTKLPQLRRLRHKAAAITFGDLVHEWRAVVLDTKELKASSREYREATIVSLYRRWPGLERRPVRDITLLEASKWATARRKECCAQRFNNERDTLTMLFKYAIEEGIVTESPVRRIERARVPKPHIAAPSIQDFFAVLRELTTGIYRHRRRHAARKIQLLAYSGMRLEEANHLQWSDIDWKRNLVHVTGGDTGTKNHEARWIPLFPDLKELLVEIGPERMGRILATGDAGKAIDNACAALGLERFTHHQLRHFFATNAVENGHTFKEIAAWLGHKDGGELVARIYSHLRQDREQASAATFSIKKLLAGSCHGQVHGQTTANNVPANTSLASVVK